MIYSSQTFSTPFASDNSRVLLISEPTHVAYYYPRSSPPPTIFTNPVQWFKTLVLVKTNGLIKALLRFVYSNFVLLLMGGYCLATRYFARTDPDKFGETDREHSRALRRFGLLPLAQLLMFYLVGYADERYFIFAYLYLLICCAQYILLRHGAPETAPAYIVWLAAGFMLIAFHYTRVNLQQAYKELPARVQENITVREDILAESRKAEHPRLLFATNVEMAAKYGALAHIVNSKIPQNMSEDNFPDFLAQYEFTHLYDEDGKWLNTPTAGFRFEPTPVPHLYKIIRAEP